MRTRPKCLQKRLENTWQVKQEENQECGIVEEKGKGFQKYDIHDAKCFAR